MSTSNPYDRHSRHAEKHPGRQAAKTGGSPRKRHPNMATNDRGLIPLRRPDGRALNWCETTTWFCMDCLQDADTYHHLDGYIRCPDCTAVWAEHHLDIEEWR